VSLAALEANVAAALQAGLAEIAGAPPAARAPTDYGRNFPVPPGEIRYQLAAQFAERDSTHSSNVTEEHVEVRLGVAFYAADAAAERAYRTDVLGPLLSRDGGFPGLLEEDWWRDLAGVRRLDSVDASSSQLIGRVVFTEITARVVVE